MKTKLQRAEEKFKAEQHRADIRRLKRAYEHFDAALAELNMSFYESDSANIKEAISYALETPMQDLARAIEAKEGEAKNAKAV